MPLTLLDAEDAIIQARSLVGKVNAEFLQEYMAPVIKAQAAQKWATVPKAVKEQMRVAQPDQYRAIVDMLGGE